MNIARNLEQSANRFPDNVAVRFEGTTISYRALNEGANRAANAMLSLGIGRGDRAALFLPNTPEFITSYLGLLKVGAVAVSINPQFKHDEVRFVLTDSAATAVITTGDLVAQVPKLSGVRHIILVNDAPVTGTLSLGELAAQAAPNAIAAEMAADEPAAILYTSGTTGSPKGVVLSHLNVLSNVEAASKQCGVRAADGLLLFVPLSHCFGQNAILNCGIRAGATVVLHRRLVLDDVLADVFAGRVSKFYGVPAVFVRLLDADTAGCDLASVDYYFSAAALLPVEIERRWAERFGRAIHQGYGLTETSPFASYNHEHSVRPGSVGTPIDGVEVKIVDEVGGDVATGELGEIVIRGPNVMLGYWNRPAETAEVMRGGWFHSGDIGKVDDDGYLYVVDRVKDLVNAAGFKVYPAEVENVLHRHPGVGEVAIYAAPDPVNGEQVRAAVVLRVGHAVETEELIEFCRRRLAAYKVPRAVAFLPALPRNASGKVLKRVLVEAAHAG